MIDEDFITVAITASNELKSSGIIGKFEGGGKGHRYTMYTVLVQNVSAGGKCVLMELVSWGHCGFCVPYEQHIADYPFPLDDCCALVTQLS
ncbi:hypothetical protein CCR75_004628 [Bremia lactucae]|uniref:Uncharacterized protein n=1 Tax=Bremia lactucae TaxID=4779 RepID=A0A976NZZ0_BRELC|nr:hypothetical protein CCR75_004628 [Bremia lactucae]